MVFPPSVYSSAVKTNEEGDSETIVINNQTTRWHFAQNKSAKPICCLYKEEKAKKVFFFSWHLQAHLVPRTSDCDGH
jgi:hypothetical protein